MVLKDINEMKKADRIKSNYLVLGQEPFLEDLIIKNLKQALFSGSQEDIVTFDLNEVSVDVVVDEANSISFFSENRLIIVTNVNFLSGQAAAGKDTSMTYLFDYLANPNPNSVILWKIQGQTLDKRKKITKAFLGLKSTLDLTSVTEKDVERFVIEHLREYNLAMSKQDLGYLLERTQYSLSQVMNELAKLRTYAYSGEINQEVISALIPRVVESDIFELTKAMMNRQVSLASQIYDDLIMQKHEPIAILALVISQFRLMIQAKILMQSGYGQADIASVLGIHPYRVKLAMQSSLDYPLERLQDLYLALGQADYDLKTGRTDKDLFFSLILTQFMRLK